MKEMIFKLAMVVSLLLSFGTAFADGNQQESSAPVQVLTYNRVEAGRNYTGKAAVTVQYNDGTSYREHFESITIDYGLMVKAFKMGGTPMFSYDSDCKYLELDEMFKKIVARRYYRSNVLMILVEIAVK